MATSKNYSFLPNAEYWERRMEERFRKVHDTEKVLFREYNKVYKNVLDDYTKMMKPYRKAGGSYDFERLQQDMLYNTGFSARVGRNQALIERLDTLTTKLATNELQLMERTLIEIYKDNYYELFYEVQKGIGYEVAFARLDENRLKQVVHTAWAKDGREFSDRIWTNKEKLTKNMRDIITNSIASGENPRTTAYKLRDATGNSFYNSQRIIRTETNALITESDKQLYGEMGMEEYEFNATFDNRTSGICGDMEGKRFKFSEMRIGYNAPPLHPNCRSTIEAVPIIDWQPPYKYGRDGFGQPTKLPADMTFDQWKKQHKI